MQGIRELRYWQPLEFHALIGHSIFVGIKQAIADFKAEAIRARQAGRA